MGGRYFESIVGFGVILISAIFCVQVYKFGSGNPIKKPYVVLKAKFSNVEGVNIGTPVKIGGVRVGRVQDIRLDENLQVVALLEIGNGVNVPEDSSVAIVSSGLLGSKYIEIAVGTEDEMLQNGDYFQSTRSAINLEGLIGNFAMGRGKK